MKKIMIDTNIFDDLVQDPFFPDIWDAISCKKLEFLTTPIQEEEIASISDTRKRRLLQSIPRTVVPEGEPPTDAPAKMRHDLMIAQAANTWADLLVTNDNRLREWFQQNYQREALDFRQFILWFVTNLAD